MPSRACLALVLISCFLCMGQAPTRQSASDKAVTRIGNHQMGETFGVWLAINADVPPAEIPAAAAMAGRRLGDACKKYIHGPQWKHHKT
jgi:hypothetical protein